MTSDAFSSIARLRRPLQPPYMGDAMDELLREIFGAPAEPPMVDLRSELAATLRTAEGKSSLIHPLCFVPDYDSKYNVHHNAALEEGLAKCERARAEGNWEDYINAHEKRFWPLILESMRGLFPPEKWAAAVRHAWILSDELWLNEHHWRKILPEASRIAGFMTEAERAKLAAMAERIAVYRGCADKNREGLSWSLKPEWAEYFARESHGWIVRGVAFKSDVLAYFEQNMEEYEIVIFPERVTEKSAFD